MPDRNVAPTVARVRLKYAKRFRMRFSSHRDFQRSFERAIRRAAVPVSFSAGFSPHPRISYINAAPTGIGSEAEYLEIGLQEVVDVLNVRAQLDATMPDGFSIEQAVPALTPDFAERMQASWWEVVLPEVDQRQADEAAQALIAAQEVQVERMTKGGIRRFDARAAVLGVEPATDILGVPEFAGPCAILQVVVRHDTPSVRPDDVLAALRHVSGLEVPVPALVTRLAQGPLVSGARSLSDYIADPLEPDFEAMRTA